MLPQEIKELKHWTTHTNKRPALNPDQWQLGLSYEEAKNRSSDIGLLVAPHTHSPYLLIDIDFPGTDEEKAQLAHYLKENPNIIGSEEHLKLMRQTIESMRHTSVYPLLTQTYTEFSPSLTGLRMIISSKDKHRFPKAYKKSSVFKGQIDFQNQFMTITELQYPGSPSSILEVPLMQLADAFGFQETAKIEVTPAAEDDEPLPAQATVIEALRTIPLDQSDRVQRIWREITGDRYEHYHFWLSIGMALHNYSGHFKKAGARFYLAFLQWSETDTAAYTGEDDVEAKWKSFGDKTTSPNITWKTILKLSNRLTFDYPRQQLDKKGIPNGCPQINEFTNFQYLLDFYGIRLHEDDGYYVSGEHDICEKYFKLHGARCWFDKYYGPLTTLGLQAATLRLCQDSKWRGLTTTATHVQTWVTQPRDDMDIFQLWLDTPFENLPREMQYTMTTQGEVNVSQYDKNSNIDYVFDCMNVQYDAPAEKALAKSMLKKTLMQMIKFREDLSLPFTDNGGMLVLIGAENTYKSTFFKLLLPQAMGHLRKEMNMQVKGEKAVRDFVRYLGKKTIVQIDEFEGMMDHLKQGAMFKAIISGDSASMTDIYQTTETMVSRKAIIVGTSNEMRQVLSDNGSRRMWFIKVNKINTSGLLHINLHKLYRDLREEFRSEYKQGIMPWLMTQDEINLLYRMNEQLAAKSDIALWLGSVWPGEDTMPPDYLKDVTSVQGYQGGKLYTTPEVMTALQFAGMPPSMCKMSALERALERHCGKFTNTFNTSMLLHKPKATIMNGRLCQGKTAQGKPKYAKWIMPPKANEKAEE